MKDTITARAKKGSQLRGMSAIGRSALRKEFNLKSKISNFKFQISNLEFQSSNFKFRISNLKSKISNLIFDFLPLCLCLSVALFLSACGYHVGGTASRLPPGLKVIAVPALKNRDHPLSRRAAHDRSRGSRIPRPHEVPDRSTEESADAVLHGEITSFEAAPAVFDTTPAQHEFHQHPSVNVTTARATTMLVSVRLKVWLEERGTKKSSLPER